ncbi:uncharacterized protein Fot_45359 [Forsythia ovata]|uniref:Agenet-like domain-containing protein n=1 Tax=Forsythia ovata TaxID=205694 RepID=A0ABD1R650_9LAMI
MSGKNLIGPEPLSREWSEVNQNIELLCEDSGMRDCWFRCKVLKSSLKLLKVQYYDVPAENRAGKLEEWFPKSKVAAADKLGMRCAGRPAIRPWPSGNSSDLPLKVGVAIDAWQCDRWREGVVTGFGTSTKDNLHVYFPGDNRFSAVERKNVRVSREWIDDKWVDIEGKPDILSFLSSNFSPKVNLPPLPPVPRFPVLAEASTPSTSTLASSKVVPSSKLQGSEDVEQRQGSATTIKAQDMEVLNYKKRLTIRHLEEKARMTAAEPKVPKE